MLLLLPLVLPGMEGDTEKPVAPALAPEDEANPPSRSESEDEQGEEASDSKRQVGCICIVFVALTGTLCKGVYLCAVKGIRERACKLVRLCVGEANPGAEGPSDANCGYICREPCLMLSLRCPSRPCRNISMISEHLFPWSA